MAAKTYFFYDLETSGLHRCFDQILQFAAILTDENFNVLQEYSWHVRYRPDIVADPGAVQVHGLTSAATEGGREEAEAIAEIHALMNTPGRISCGYNTLGFDDEFLRFGFYRNLLSPYTHQYANGCGRIDIFPMTVLARWFEPEVLHWPEREGFVSFKLEDLNRANDAVEGMAHDALVDVRATVALAKRLRARESFWNYTEGYFKKSEDERRQQQCPKWRGWSEGLYVDAEIGKKHDQQSYCLGLGKHEVYGNQSLWLRLDRESFSAMSAEEFLEKAWVIHKKNGEKGFVLPAKDRFLKHFSPERKALIADNQRWLASQEKLLELCAEKARTSTYPIVENVDADARLYLEGFWTPEQQRWMQNLKNKNFSEQCAMVKAQKASTLKELAVRILWRQEKNALPDWLEDRKKTYFEAWKNKNIWDHQGKVKRF